MLIDVVISASQMLPEQIKNKSVCVIDVFRATSVMITALENGARRIIPVRSVEEAFAHRKCCERQGRVLLGGERDTVLIPGFDLDNSPLAYTPQRVSETTIIFTTTNGTQAIKKAQQYGADSILIGAIINNGAACRRLQQPGGDITLVCSGREGHYTMEDALCAGMMVERLAQLRHVQVTDLAWTLRDLYLHYRGDLRQALTHGQHYNFMLGHAMELDIAYCLQMDCTHLVPWVNGSGEVVR